MSQNSQITLQMPLVRPLPRYAQLPRPVVPRIDSLKAGSLTPWHRHDWWQLTYAISGVLTVQTAHGSYMAPPQRAIWVPPRMVHKAINVALTEMHSLYIDNALMAWAPPRCRVVSMNTLVRELIVAIGKLPEQYDTDGAPGRMAQVLVDQLSELPEVDFNLPMPTDPRLMQICTTLQAKPDDNRSMTAWGQRVGLSERSISRLFAEQTGLSFGDWRQRLRLLLALTALESGQAVTRAALDAGYASPSAFIAAFKRNFGITPTEMFKRS
jgi:AraC-like DNA-binding protein